MEKNYSNEDQILLNALRKDSEKAFNQIYVKYWELVYNDAFRRLKSPAAAKDITQDIFINLWTRRQSQDIKNLRSYLRVSVRNRVLNFFEKENRYLPFEKLLIKIKEQEDTDFQLIKNEFMTAYKELVAKLPQKRRRIFQYHFDENLSTDQIAEKLEISRKTVQNQLGRAVTSLKTDLTHLLIIVALLCLG